VKDEGRPASFFPHVSRPHGCRQGASSTHDRDGPGICPSAWEPTVWWASSSRARRALAEPYHDALSPGQIERVAAAGCLARTARQQRSSPAQRVQLNRQLLPCLPRTGTGWKLDPRLQEPRRCASAHRSRSTPARGRRTVDRRIRSGVACIVAAQRARTSQPSIACVLIVLPNCSGR
jgi:hypothetical protein